MARIPTVVADGKLDAAPQTMPRLDRTSADTNALGELGGQIQKAGADMFEREKRNKESLEDFVTDQKFQRHGHQLSQELDRARDNAPEGGLGLTEGFTKQADEKNREFLTSGEIPPRLAERYKARAETLRSSLELKASEYEHKTRTDYFAKAIDGNAGQMAAGVDNDPDSLVAARETLYGTIDRAALPAAQKAALKSRHGLALANAGINGLIRQGRHDEARDLATAVSGMGRGEKQGGPIAMNDEKRAARDVLTKVATEAGVPADTVIAIASLESGLNPRAKNTSTGAGGLFQIMPKERDAAGDDIETQARYGVQRLQRDAADLDKRGIPITPVTVYMAHFQGAGATEKILKADPSAPLKDTLDSARPGYRNKETGESWGEIVIRQNKLKANSTTGDFIGSMTRKVNGALIAAGTTELGFSERAALVDKTETLIRADDNRRKGEQREAIRTTKSLVDNDVASILSKGVEIGELSEQRVADHLGEDAAREWIVKREHARRFYAETKDFDSLPTADIQDRLTSLADNEEKAAGTGGFLAAKQVYGDAKKKADAILKLREDDLARSVEGDSSVAAALGALDPSKPQTVQNLVAARYAAQDKIGTPPNAREPITNREGRELAGLIEAAPAGERNKALRQVVTDIQIKYGEFADDVLKSVAGQFVKDREAKERVASVIKQLGMGQPVALAEARKTDVAINAERAEAAMQGRDVTDPARRASEGVPFTAGAGGGAGSKAPAPTTEIERLRLAKPPVTREIDRASWERLVANPEIAPAFDAEFGAGVAQWVLKSVELTTQRGDRKPTGTDGANPK